MTIGHDTRLTGGSEIRDDEMACLATEQGLAFAHSDRVYWRAGCGAEDLLSESEWSAKQEEELARAGGGS